MDTRHIWASSHGVVLLVGLAAFAFGSGYWGILLALAPAAYLLVLYPADSANAPEVVIVSHLVALFAGWMAYTALAPGISPTSIEPMSEAGLRLVGAALLAFIGWVAVSYAVDLNHPMAVVTAFTAALGAFPSGQGLVVAVLAVLLVAGLQVLRLKLGPDRETGHDGPVGEYPELSNRP